jgi:hypothetical protein
MHFVTLSTTPFNDLTTLAFRKDLNGQLHAPKRDITDASPHWEDVKPVVAFLDTALDTAHSCHTLMRRWQLMRGCCA